MTANGRVDGLFWRPSTPETVVNNMWTRKMDDARPFCDGVRDPIKRHASIASRIVRLFAPRSPFAIPRRVRPVVIDAFNRGAARTIPHVFEKRRKIIAPLIAHGDAAPAIFAKIFNVWVIASLFRVCPRAKLWRITSPMLTRRMQDILFQATTAARFTRAQHLPERDCRLTAVAPACISHLVAWLDARNNSESAEALVEHWYCAHAEV